MPQGVGVRLPLPALIKGLSALSSKAFTLSQPNTRFILKSTIAEPTSTQRTLDIEMPQSAIKGPFDSKIAKYSKEIEIKGFRKGKVPRKMIVARFGAAIRQEAVEEAIDIAIKSELEKAKIEPIAQGTIEKFEDDKENDIKFTVLVEVDPEIEIKDYDNLNVVPEAVTVEDSEIETEIEAAQKQFAEETVVEGASASGHVLEGQYLKLIIEGEERPVPENPAFRIEIGASRTPGFDEHLEGITAGETKEISFSFPDDYGQAELDGKDAIYTIQVESIKSLELPALDDEFAKKLGAESFDEFKASLKENISKYKMNQSKTKAHDAVMEILIERNGFEVPEARVKYYAEQTLQKKEGETASEEEVSGLRDQAISEIKKYRILEEISKTEKIKVKQAEVDARIQEIAAMYGMEFNELKSQLRSSGRIVGIREELKKEKTLDFLVGIRETEAVEA